MNMKSNLTGIVTAAAALSGLLTGPAAAQEPPAAPQGQAYCSSDIQPYRSSIFLAYIKSSTAQDSVTEAGLRTLANRLAEKTSLEESARDRTIRVKGLDIEQDDLCFFPALYMSIDSSTPPLSQDAQEKLNLYLNGGWARGPDGKYIRVGQAGTLIIDIRDASMEWDDVRRNILGSVNLGAIEPMPRNHTLRNTFYANSELPGSLNLAPVRVQVPMSNSGENTSRVIVGIGRNWAAAWAGMTLSRSSRAYEMAIRGGINLFLYTFTGNYKSDQLLYEKNLRELKP